MSRHKAARQPCGGRAVTEPDAKPSIRQGSRVENTTSIKSSSRRSAEIASPEAEILVGTTMWLDRVRDWLAEVLDLPPTATAQPGSMTLRGADLEAFRDGLSGAISVLDHLTVDPAQLPSSDERSAAPRVATATTAGRTVH